MVINSASKDLRSRLIPSSSVQLKMKDDELKQLLSLVDLLDKCLQLDPAKRLTPRDALLHPFVAGPWIVICMYLTLELVCISSMHVSLFLKFKKKMRQEMEVPHSVGDLMAVYFRTSSALRTWPVANCRQWSIQRHLNSYPHIHISWATLPTNNRCRWPTGQTK